MFGQSLLHVINLLHTLLLVLLAVHIIDSTKQDFLSLWILHVF